MFHNAVDAKNKDSLISKQTIYATINGEKRAYIIEKHQNNDGSTKFELIYQVNILKKISYELTGFEDEVLPCKTESGYLGDQFKDVLCLTGNVGVHSQNLSLVRVLSNKFEPVYFKSGADKLLNIVSDVPNIRLKDYNNDGKDELIVDSRDYDNDPTVNSIESAYIWRDGNFESIKEVLY